MKKKNVSLNRILLLVGILLTCSLSSFGQGRSISGLVNDINGQPVPGASVMEKEPLMVQSLTLTVGLAYL